MSGDRRAFWAAALAAIIVSVPTLGHGFINWDDPAQVMANPLVAGGGPVPVGEIFRTSVVHQYHPLVTLAFAVEYRIFGSSPLFFHLDNLLVHLFNVFLVSVLCSRLGIRPGVGLWAGLLCFAIHPAQAAAVASISARKDLMATSFFLLSLLVYRKRGPGFPGSALALICFLGALLCKATTVTLPLVLLGLEWVLDGLTPRKIWEKLPFFLLALFFGLQAARLQPFVEGRAPSAISSAALGVSALGFYMEKFLFPVGLAPLYPLTPGSFVPGFRDVLGLTAAAGGAVLVSVSAARRRLSPRGRTAVFGIAFAVVCLLPVLRIVPFGGDEIAALRFLYLPLAGAAVALGSAPEGTARPGMPARLAVVAVVCCWGINGLILERYWGNSRRFWTEVVKRHPGYALARHQLGQAYYGAGDYPGARRECAVSIELRSDQVNPRVIAALSASQMGDYATARRLLEEAALLLRERGDRAREEEVEKYLRAIPEPPGSITPVSGAVPGARSGFQAPEPAQAQDEYQGAGSRREEQENGRSFREKKR
ncbi:MAG TPA: hypothetical protein PLZ73_00500 [bacterium]|nr:hypothetical protein [bacterium]